ncbi:MAG: MBL fold metallo-hydrolase [Candidatus Omnitrophica bacterium]|nr:MBL fold metallo-hydrolase [Candidatus Omnitrophota bacterium]
MVVKTFPIGPINTNCYVVYDADTKDGVIIDPAVYSKDIADFIKDNNIDIKYTINTHGHYDHIGGNNDFGYPIIIHELDEDCLRRPEKSFSIMHGMFFSNGKAFKKVVDGDVIKAGSLEFKVIHTPGHTLGGITLESNGVLFTGDTLFKDGIGRTDLPFCSHKDIISSLKKLMRFPDDTVFYPGHGPASTIGDERR